MPKKFLLPFDSEVNLTCYLWETNLKNPKGVIIIAHGMSEHILRYDQFATFLATRGFHVVGYDHYGHGESAISIDKIGIIEKYDFFDALIKGLKLVCDEIKEKYDLSFYLFAHSMGSIMAQRYIQLYPDDFSKVILSGVTYNSFKVKAGKPLIHLIQKVKGKLNYSKLIYKLSIEPFTKLYQDEHKLYGWISSSPEEISKYANNPYCGAPFPNNYFYSLSKTLGKASKKKNIKMINPNTKIFIISGEKDPVGAFGKAAQKINKAYIKNHLSSEYKIYTGARHECYNEVENIKNIVYEDIFTFLNR